MADDAPIWSAAQYQRFASSRDDRVRAWALARLGLLHPERAAAHVVAALGEASTPVTVVHAAFAAVADGALGASPEVRAALDRFALDAHHPLRTARAYAAQLVLDAQAARASDPFDGLSSDELVARLAALRDGEHPAAERVALARACAARPDVLRAWAAGALRDHAGSHAARVAWAALLQQDRPWATDVALEGLVASLDRGEFETPWVALEALGDPRALDAVVREWRAGEAVIARVAVLLAALAGTLDALPAALRGDADAAWARQAAALAERAVDDAGLVLALRCNRCGRAYHYEAGQAFVHPDPHDAARDGWDGVALTRVVRCKRCGAVDDYALTGAAAAALKAGLERALTPAGEPITTGPVVLGVSVLADGTELHRASAALRHQRALAEAPDAPAAAWRRYGNLAERLGEIATGEAAWGEAVALDPHEYEAAYSLLRLLRAANRLHQAWPLALRLVESLPRVPLEAGQRANAAALAVDVLRAVVPSQPAPVVLRASWVAGRAPEVGAVDLARFEQWAALAGFLASGELVAVRLVAGGDDPLERSPLVRRLASGRTVGLEGDRVARVGRNDACPCGSGRKYKRCCGP